MSRDFNKLLEQEKPIHFSRIDIVHWCMGALASKEFFEEELKQTEAKHLVALTTIGELEIKLGSLIAENSRLLVRQRNRLEAELKKKDEQIEGLLYAADQLDAYEPGCQHKELIELYNVVGQVKEARKETK